MQEYQESIFGLADQLVLDTKSLLTKAISEDDLKIGFEKLLEPIRESLGLKFNSSYGQTNIFSKRPDAVHGGVIIEYEPPRSFSSNAKVEHAFKQLKDDYLPAVSANPGSLIGVGLDGEKIFFVRKRDDEWVFDSIHEFNTASARTFLIHLRALSRIPLNAANLAKKFGPESEIAPKAIGAFARALEHGGNQSHVRTYFNEWERIFGIVYGDQFGNASDKDALVSTYHAGEDIDFHELLFCVHTYFAFLMKLISAELVTLKDTSFHSSLALRLASVPDHQLKNELEEIESGGIYAKRGITNFLEGDFFKWYLYLFDWPELKDAIRDIMISFSEFEPSTTLIEPDETRDLLKKLYQYLVPKEVRHGLGEYYTPDWLAELTIKEVGYDGNSLRRVLDPACGSGTFLVLAIQKVIEKSQQEKLPSLEIAKRIVSNIRGFDLNPIAVIAARTNYLFALGDLINNLEKFEIPIYLADSILWPEQIANQTSLDFAGGEEVKITTSIKEFYVPALWIKDKGLHMPEAASLTESLLNNDIEPRIAISHYRDKGLVIPTNQEVVLKFYTDLLLLKRQQKDGIWVKFLKNAFAPMTAGKFDYVIGNPPWIRWEYLSKEYRNATLPLWRSYELFSLKGYAALMGRGGSDFSMLFTYAASDHYLKPGGAMGFLITQEVFKSKGSGEGFRRFKIGNKGDDLGVIKVHDFVKVQPFEGASNKTSLLIMTRGRKTIYPVPYFVWDKRKGKERLRGDMLLETATSLLSKESKLAKPIGKATGFWQIYKPGDEEKNKQIAGKNHYRARSGAYAVPYGVFWVDVLQVLSDGNIIIKNRIDRSRTVIQQVEETVENELVFPIVQGRDINRWHAQPSLYSLIVNDPEKPMMGYPEDLMQKKWLRTYGYLIKFKDVLLKRAAYVKFHSTSNAPFYSQYNIGSYTFSDHKIVWKRMANDISAAVVGHQKTPFGFKRIIPTDTVTMISTESEDEAHYLCGLINSEPIRDYIKSSSSAGRAFGTPSVVEHINIRKFSKSNELHLKLVELSKECHQLQISGDSEKLTKLEHDINSTVKILFGIT